MKHVCRWSRCWSSRGYRESKKVAILSVLTTHMCSPGLCPCFFSCSILSLSNIPYSAWLLKYTSQPLASLLNSRYGLPAALLATSSWLRYWHLLYGMNHTYYLLPNPFLWCHFFFFWSKIKWAFTAYKFYLSCVFSLFHLYFQHLSLTH